MSTPKYKIIYDKIVKFILTDVWPVGSNMKSENELIKLFEKNLKVLHPFMPFLTEEIFHNLPDVNLTNPLTTSSWPTLENYNQNTIDNFEITKEIISQIRNYRKEKNISFKTSLDLYYLPNKGTLGNIEIIKKIASIDILKESTKNDFEMVNSFLIKNFEFFIPLEEGFDKGAEIEKLKKELDYNDSFLKSVQNKLKNENFINNAPKTIINKEKQKIIDTEQKIKSLKKSISDLS